MPLYEYQCSKCEKLHEIIQKFSDPPLKKCPDCGEKMEKLMSRSAFSLKGQGWYVSDYKKPQGKGSGGGESSSGSSTGSSNTGGSKPKSD